MRFQIHPGLNSMAHGRQVHRGRFVSEYVQLATTASVTFRVTNSSLYVDAPFARSTYKDEFVTTKATLRYVASCEDSKANGKWWACRA